MSHSARMRRRRHGAGPGKYTLLALLVVLLLGTLAGVTAIGWVVRTANSSPQLSSLKERNPGSLTEVFADDGTRLGFIQNDELVTPGTNEVNPLHVPATDLVGHRYRTADVLNYVVGVNAQLLF